MRKVSPQNKVNKKNLLSPIQNYFKKLVLLFFMQDDPIGNINLAMEIAEKHLDIPKMLDAEGEMKITELQKKICGLLVL